MTLDRTEGQIVFRRSGKMSHRLVLNTLGYEDIDDDLESRGYAVGDEADVWTLFITGPKTRDWGFWCGRRWVPWQAFTKPIGNNKSGGIGKGCGED